MISDEQYMQRAIDLALLGGVAVAPNPMVGAVIVHRDRIIGEGYHQVYGGPHAEVNAVNSVADRSLLAESTIYVTLEPCAHFGKTPPCADLLIQENFKRVVIGTIDPFAEVAGKGIERLQEAGIEVTTDVLRDRCLEVNKRFFTFHQKKRPYVFLKWAQTRDGFIDLARDEHETGVIHWISSPETQPLVHHWRSLEQAILVGWKTVLNDDPSLTVREVKGRNPLRIVVDSQLKAPIEATLLNDNRPTVILNTLKNEETGAVRYVKIPSVSTKDILQALAELNILSVIVEGGSKTLQHFIVDQHWDEAHVIVGDTRFGSGTKAPVISGLPRKTIAFSSDRIYEYRRV